MDKREKLIQTLIEEAEKDGEPITREEAEEMADMEIKANEVKDYTQSSVEKKPKQKREVKKDETKVEFIKKLYDLLLTTDVENAIIVNEQKEITFVINDENYSLSLIKHRKPKKKEN